MSEPTEQHEVPGVIAAIVRPFLTGPPAMLVILAAVLLGVIAVLITPREEDPQIVVPMADVLVAFPGHSPAEVEELVTGPLERLLWQVQGVEHVYSVSRRDQAMVTVRFFVGLDRDRCMVRLRDRMEESKDLVPQGVAGWLVRPVEIDDVPIVSLTLYSERMGHHDLRRLAEEMQIRMESVRNISRTVILGGLRREIRVELEPLALASRGLSFSHVVEALQRDNHCVTAGQVLDHNQVTDLCVGGPLATVEQVARTVLMDRGGRVVRLQDVGSVLDTAEEPSQYVHAMFGPGSNVPEAQVGKRFPAVTLGFSKKRGSNAVDVADDILAAAERLRPDLLSSGVGIQITRNYGRTADEKVNTLLLNMGTAILTVVGVITLFMGWREGLVVGLAVPVSFCLALFTNMVAGYTINRVTLFALILSLGLVVDDPITNVDNIQRHIRMGRDRPLKATLRAVQEVSPAVIMSTLAIIVCFLPMFFITGMMGPYMRPMAVNVPVTVTFSTLCALTFVPWLSYKLLKRLGKDPSEGPPPDVTPKWIRKGYRTVVSPFLKLRYALLLLLAILLLLGFSGFLVLSRRVPLKMLPFDNKDEFQVLLDLPEGTSLERTEQAVRDVSAYLAALNEVTDLETYTGTHSPIDFNGLVRHYNLRQFPHQADIRVNLVPRNQREASSHNITLRIRQELTDIAERHGAVLHLVEIPPGPPVWATLTIEIRGEIGTDYNDLIQAGKILQDQLRAEDSQHIAEIDDYAEAPHPRLVFQVDRDKAAMNGLRVAEVAQLMRTALHGVQAGLLHVESERNPLRIIVRNALRDRFAPGQLLQMWVPTPQGQVQLHELGTFREVRSEQPIYHKDLDPVAYVTAETVGRPPGEIIWDMLKRLDRDPLPEGILDQWAGEGEWQITVRVFRDLGIAFGAAMAGIYLLLVLQMRSFTMPLLVLTAIPLTAVGIMPGFWLLNLVAADTIGGFPAPIYFTATAMIGMIALGGIVIRNSLVLIEFIQDSQAEGASREEAILESGAVRFRPIVLTALTTMLGAWPITTDPIFSGLAWSLIFGLAASTAFTLIVVPAAYQLVGPSAPPTTRSGADSGDNEHE